MAKLRCCGALNCWVTVTFCASGRLNCARKIERAEVPRSGPDMVSASLDRIRPVESSADCMDALAALAALARA